MARGHRERSWGRRSSIVDGGAAVVTSRFSALQRASPRRGLAPAERASYSNGRRLGPAIGLRVRQRWLRNQRWIGMLTTIFEHFTVGWGPGRLLTSYSFLAALATAIAVISTLILLPKLWKYLPRDSGRQFAVDADKSIGKPLSAGIIIVSIFAVVVLLVIPPRSTIVLLMPLMIVASVVGLLDDKKKGGLSELTLGLTDLALALLTVLILFGFRPVEIWIPIYSGGIVIPASLNIPMMTAVIWLAINAMNCSDGVDGLSANLACVTLASLAGLLYIAIGNVDVANYLRVPHNAAGADWSLVALTMVGCLFGYLWYNAPPSMVLMGDSGSRPIGLLIGALVAMSGNPVILVVCGLIILTNGATGLVKVLLIRLFRIRILRDVRFPLHDHARQNLNWAGTQVLFRFSLIHFAVTALLLTLLLKVR